MSDYTLQECAITVPDVFRDRTMNLFTLSNASANEFTFVISRATASVDDTLHSVSTRLSKELDTNLQSLALIHVQLTELDGQQALELFYSFQSGQRTLFQKQRIVLLDEKFQGKKLLCFIGTSTDTFDDYHTRIYDRITASIRFHHSAPATASNDIQIPADSPALHFAFDRDSRELAVFQGIARLYAGINLNRAKNGDYLFFNESGDRLMIAPLTTDGDATRYALWETADGRKQSILPSLLLAKTVRGVPGLDTTDAIEAHISQQRNRE